jgi:DNA invertase Pin-like site-specific DNA recombinase
MRVALYVRVSKVDESQNPENQLLPLRNYAKAANWEIVKECVDFGSGGSPERESFVQMLDDSERKAFDVLLVWAWDRFTREGIANALGYLKRLRKNGVAIKSLCESWLDTTESGVGELLLTISK